QKAKQAASIRIRWSDAYLSRQLPKTGSVLPLASCQHRSCSKLTAASRKYLLCNQAPLLSAPFFSYAFLHNPSYSFVDNGPIDDEETHAEAVAESLQRVGYACTIATSGKAGAARIDDDELDIILTDLRMPDMDGLAILRKAKQANPATEVFVITGHGDVKTAVEAIKQGAANYLTKPVDMGELGAVVDKAA